MERMEDQAGAAANHFFQGLAAVLAKDAAQTVTRAYLDSKYRDVPDSLDSKGILLGQGGALLFIHDEVLSEVREASADKVARKQSEIMVTVGKRHCPDVLIAAPPALARRWYKSMEAVTNEKGELIPWQPN
jgi:DNA polymerase I-like protein with 3'-5' exonuclease and polymerase domains